MFRLISVSKQLSVSKKSSKISSVLSRNAATMKGKNFMAIQDLSTAELEGLIDHSIALKEVTLLTLPKHLPSLDNRNIILS
jgi:hypothetical protein